MGKEETTTANHRPCVMAQARNSINVARLAAGAIAHWKYRSTTSLRKPSKSRLASVLIDVFVSTVSGMEVVH